jgi:hypothetical protein
MARRRVAVQFYRRRCLGSRLRCAAAGTCAVDIMGLLASVLPLVILVVVALYILPRFFGNVGGVVCTRCDGTGQVNERWPDPSKPGGWHILEGTCPKCKGKGKVRVR